MTSPNIINRKKVVFAINNLGMGGAENMLVEQVKQMDKRRFEIIVMTILPNKEGNIIDKLPEDITFMEFNLTGISDLGGVYRLSTFLRKEKVDAIITSLFDANLLGRVAAVLAGVPVILSSELNVSEDKRYWQIFADWILSLFTKKILVSSNEVLDFTSEQEHIPNNKFQLNFNAIPLRLGKVRETRDVVLKKYGLSTEGSYIVNAGSLTPQKGQKFIIEAVRLMKESGVSNFKVLIFGRGVLKDELTKQIESLGLESDVLFMGFASIDDIMAISDIFTLPSLWEGLSIALLNSMDAGCPIVATRVSGTNEALVDGDSALLITPGSSTEMAKAFTRLLKDKDLRQRLSEGAKEQVKKFSIEKNVKVIENLISADE